MNMCHQTENVNNLVIYKKKDMKKKTDYALFVCSKNMCSTMVFTSALLTFTS